MRSRPRTRNVRSLPHGERRAHGDLDVLGGSLTDEQTHRAPDVLHDRFIHLVAADPHRRRGDDAAEGDDGDLGGAATDVHDHRSARGVDRKACADGSRHGFLDQVSFTRAGHRRGVGHRALLDFGHARRNSEHHARVAHVPRPIVRAGDEMTNHLLGVLEVRDHAVAQRTHRDDVGGRATEHSSGFSPDGEHLAGALAHCNDRWLVDDDAAPADVHQGVGGPEVDAHVGRPDPQHGGQ